jgi:5-methylcytosine-specific restriction endonuclease McrA
MDREQTPEFLRLRALAFERDDYACTECHSDGRVYLRDGRYYVNLDGHHIIPRRLFAHPKDANTLGNLRSLCTSCHGRIDGAFRRAERIGGSGYAMLLTWSEGPR